MTMSDEEIIPSEEEMALRILKHLEDAPPYEGYEDIDWEDFIDMDNPEMVKDYQTFMLLGLEEETPYVKEGEMSEEEVSVFSDESPITLPVLLEEESVVGKEVSVKPTVWLEEESVFSEKVCVKKPPSLEDIEDFEPMTFAEYDQLLAKEREEKAIAQSSEGKIPTEDTEEKVPANAGESPPTTESPSLPYAFDPISEEEYLDIVTWNRRQIKREPIPLFATAMFINNEGNLSLFYNVR